MADFTSAECNLLVNLVEKNLDTLRGQFLSTITNAKKQSCGKLLIRRLTAWAVKNVHQYEEIQGKWRNIAQIEKKTNSRIMQCQKKTSRGPAAKPPTTTTAKNISLT